MITSSANPRVKRLVALRDRRDRDRENVFVAEGMRAVDRLLVAGRRVNELYVQRSCALEGLIDRAHATGAEIVELSEAAMAKASYREKPEGVLAVCPQWHLSLSELALSTNPLVLIVEAIEKPGNLGAILRTADAVACDAVVVCDQKVDLFNPNVVRASTGVLFSMPIVLDGAQNVRAWTKACDLRTVATTPDTRTVYWDADLTGPIAVLMGTEDDGLSDAWLSTCDERVRFPMTGQADSLNVATSTALVLYEALRQRRATH